MTAPATKFTEADLAPSVAERREARAFWIERAAAGIAVLGAGAIVGGMIALVASAPAFAEAGVQGLDALLGSVVMPDGPPVMVNGVDLTAVLRRILDVKEEKPAAKAPVGKVVAKKPTKKAKP